MGYSTTDGPAGKGLGSFNNTASTEADFDKVIDLIGQRGNLREGTTTERDALTSGQLYQGLHFFDKTTGILWVRGTSSWEFLTAKKNSSTITPTAGANFSLSSNTLYTRAGWLLGTIDWTRTSGTLSHADVILTMPAGYGPAFDVPVGGSMGPSPFLMQQVLFRTATRDVFVLSPASGRTSGTIAFTAPLVV